MRFCAPCLHFGAGAGEGVLELEAVVGAVDAADGAAQRGDGVGHDGQTQTGAAALARPAGVYAVKAVEEVRQCVLGHAYAIVVKAEGVVGAAVREAVAHQRAPRAVAVVGSVARQVHEHGGEEVGVAAHVGAYGYVERKVHLAYGAALTQVVGKGVHQVVVVQNFGVYEVAAFVQAGYGRHVGYEVYQAVGMVARLGHKVSRGAWVQVGVVHQGVQIALDDADGGFQLVVDVVGKLALLERFVLDGFHSHLVLVVQTCAGLRALVVDGHHAVGYLAQFVARKVGARYVVGVGGHASRKVAQQRYVAVQRARAQVQQQRNHDGHKDDY